MSFFFFFFLTCAYKGKGGGIRTCDLHFIRRDSQPIELPLRDGYVGFTIREMIFNKLFYNCRTTMII
jgi:hypothetical protein